jgi:3-methylcrotonyl-CoA carboxylase alpha subunit
MFNKILIANRGEVACRVMRTAHRMGIATVAVYSEADANAAHAAMAGEAFCIGPPPAKQSYLDAERILAVALRSGAQAIHPGYGFLSENADFAQACAEKGIVFIGPPPASIRAMGSKAAAKSLMAEHRVPLVPGYHGNDQSPATLRQAALSIGFPVLLKASAGGGGRGMRVVAAAHELDEAIERAKSEARASFGDDHLLIEKYLTRPRHIEVQVFADSHGNCLSLFERDCSIQRRHQKVVEESPGPSVTAEQRQALSAAAIAAASAVGYVGAGTVEFIAENDAFYFMEMNTRLQVEHPVTEFVTGLDLVEWQLRVAAGEPLPLRQADIAQRGHAVEVRICAEDPARDFAPATGKIRLLRQPAESPFVRIDTGIRQGDQVTAFYDSMLAKLIVWDQTRAGAIRRLRTALADYALVGPATNLDLLRGIAASEDFARGDVDTGFITRHADLLHASNTPPPAHIWAAAALTLLTPPTDAANPWNIADGWRLNAPAEETLPFAIDGEIVTIAAQRLLTGAWRLVLPSGESVEANGAWQADGELVVHTGGARHAVRVIQSQNEIVIVAACRDFRFHSVDPYAAPGGAEGPELRLTAPTPARVAGVFVATGEHVTKGQKLLSLEAMKVETVFSAPADGVIEAGHVAQDEMVQEGAQLVTFVKPAEV